MLSEKDWSRIQQAWLRATPYEASRTYAELWVRLTVRPAPPCWSPAKAIIRLEYRGPGCCYSSQWFDHPDDVKAKLERLERAK